MHLILSGNIFMNSFKQICLSITVIAVIAACSKASEPVVDSNMGGAVAAETVVAE